MENNFIQMAASACHEVVYTVGPIFKHIIDCVQLYFTNGFRNIFFFIWKDCTFWLIMENNFIL